MQGYRAVPIHDLGTGQEQGWEAAVADSRCYKAVRASILGDEGRMSPILYLYHLTIRHRDGGIYLSHEKTSLTLNHFDGDRASNIALPGEWNSLL